MNGTKKVKDYFIDEKIGESINYTNAKDVVNTLKKLNMITERESKIILYSIDDQVLFIPIPELKDKVRANILQNIVIGLLIIDEST